MARTLVLYLVAVLALASAVGAAVWYFTLPPATTAISSSRPETSPVKPTLATLQNPQGNPEIKLPVNIQIRFREVTKEAGIDFHHFDGRTIMEYIMDQTGSGLAWLDYDQDGLMDLFLVQGYTFVPPFPQPVPTCKLYKNLGGGK